jgi:hypothetical protein
LFIISTAFAGTGKVNFGAYAAGQGCSGTGICNAGSVTGAAVTFNYYQNLDTAGGTFKKLVMVVNYEQAAEYGFTGSPNGGTYVFHGGYPFNHPGDQNLGVPSTFSIPADYACIYGPKDPQGKIRLVITEFTLHK